MASQEIWTEEISIKSYETDFQTHWKPASIFQVMQETAAHHASHFGYAYRDMLAANMIWVLSRVKIRFFTFPEMEQTVVVRTWPKGIQQKVFFMRDYQLSSPDGLLYAAATSAWILINPTARRMLLPNALPHPVPNNEGLSALDEPLERLAVPDGLPERLRAQAGYSAVDVMAHVNNARYIEWISDCFSLDEYQARSLSWLQINYINEVKPGQCIAITAGEQISSMAKIDGETIWAVQGTNLSTSARAFEAHLAWKEKG